MSMFVFPRRIDLASEVRQFVSSLNLMEDLNIGMQKAVVKMVILVAKRPFVTKISAVICENFGRSLAEENTQIGRKYNQVVSAPFTEQNGLRTASVSSVCFWRSASNAGGIFLNRPHYSVSHHDSQQEMGSATSLFCTLRR